MSDPLQPEQGNHYPDYLHAQSFITPTNNWYPPFSSNEQFHASIPPPNVSCNVPPPNFERHSEYSVYENKNCAPVVSYKDKFSPVIFVPPFPPPPVAVASFNKPPPITQSITSYVDSSKYKKNLPNCDLPEPYYQNKQYPNPPEHRPEFVQYPIPPKYDNPSTYKDSLNFPESHMNAEDKGNSFNEQWDQSEKYNFHDGNEWSNFSRNSSEYSSYSSHKETTASNKRKDLTMFDEDGYNMYQHDDPIRYKHKEFRSQSPTRNPHSRSETPVNRNRSRSVSPSRRKRSRSRSLARRKSTSQSSGERSARHSVGDRSSHHSPERRRKHSYGNGDRSGHCRSPDRRSSCRSPDKRPSHCRSPDKRPSRCRSPDKRSSHCRSPDKRSSHCRSPDTKSPSCQSLRKSYSKSDQDRSQEVNSRDKHNAIPDHSKRGSRHLHRHGNPSGLSYKSVNSESGISSSSKITSRTLKSSSSARNFEKRSSDISWISARSSEEPSRSPNNSVISKQSLSERESLLEKWRENYCATRQEMQDKLLQLSKMKPEEIIEHEKKVWTRAAPADLYYTRDETNPIVMRATPRQLKICQRFCDDLVMRAEKVRQTLTVYEPPPRKNRMKLAKHKSEVCSSSDSSEESSTDEEDCTMEELERKRLHPHRLHSEMWYNDSGEMNDGPLCRCSAKARRHGIRHGIYAGEHHLLKCDVDTNNADKLHHYRITISPPTNFLTKTPTIIKHDEHEFIFEGFSMFSHFPLEKLPTCKVIRFNIEYTILYIHEKLPENFTIRELDLFHDYLFKEVLELIDLDCKASGDSTGCSQFHFMPRFVRDLPDNGKEVLSMNEVLAYLLDNSKSLLDKSRLGDFMNMPQFKWQNLADEVKGMVVTYPGKKPCSVRVDQLDRDQRKHDPLNYPEIVHFGIRPPQLSYAGNPEYQKAWREYVKFRHLLANMPKPSYEDKRKLEAKENKLQEMRTQSKMKRDVTVAVSAEGFHRTGIMCDMIQHAMLIPVLVCHLRFHRSCDTLEKVIDYKFENRFLLQLALTHPSYRENFGTNPDHARNSLTNCGIRQPEYGDRRIHYMNTRKRGINTLINIMSRFGKKQETESNITHNERLEFLGDAVVEFLTSIHLFHMFPDLEEGGLATYRAALVQNQHLAVLAKTLNLEEFMLYAHGSDLCHDLELRHAMANCFEALMGALFMDGGIEVADKVFAETLFKNEKDLLDVWVNYPPHPLQEQEPQGDRKWIPSFELLQKLTKFEETIGVDFKHIRLLARAFTDRSIGYTNLTLGSNQRLEFLGDTVLQLIASEYLYRFFPEHHEGHLSLLRSSLVNNRTQAVVCDDLGMTSYALYAHPKGELKTKDRADLLEAFLGALYVDKGLEHCHVFCHVCFFPRLQDFIMNQDWNDPKSKLQQCCLTLRTMEGGEPDIPLYKVIECKGPTNTRVYTVAVYFRGERLAKASGHSIQMAEMNAAKEALAMSQDLFPQLDHQKRVIAKSMKKQRWPNRNILRGRPKH